MARIEIIVLVLEAVAACIVISVAAKRIVSWWRLRRQRRDMHGTRA